MSNIIEFKGLDKGVYLKIDSSHIDKVILELKNKLEDSKEFFKGTNFLGIKSDKLTIKEKLELTYMLKYKYDFNIDTDDILKTLKDHMSNEIHQEKIKKDKKTSQEKKEKKLKENNIKDKGKSEQVVEGKTKFIYGTLRSGQEVSYNGNIVVIGDVNPGAFLKAQGNIIVLGTMRGVAYAGLNGNNKAIVAAYRLIPTQLRIAKKIVRAPDDDTSNYKLPEVAKIIENEVIIEPYLPKK